jgi:hypothetical protein
MLTILVEVDSKKLGGDMLLLPFEETWLAANTCLELLLQVLVRQLYRPIARVTAEQVKMLCSKQEVVTKSGLAARLEKEVSNATGCIDMLVLSVITTRPTASPTRSIINPFDRMLKIQTVYISLPPRLNYVRMYANHDGYNALIDFLEENKLGWTTHTASTFGKRFVEGISKAFFECNPSTWKTLNDRHNTGSSRIVNCVFIAFACV